MGLHRHPAGVAASDTVDSVAPGTGVPDLIGTDTVLVNGTSTTETRFGDFSSVAIEPTKVDGSCAVAAQQCFAGTAPGLPASPASAPAERTV